MMEEHQATAVLGFIEQYAAFLNSMANNEKEKLAALVSNNLERIERAILTAQADAKQLENLEKKRMALLSENGCGGFTLAQLCEATPIALRARMSELCQSVREGIDEIKFNNTKSMGVARSNIIQVNPDAVLTTVKGETAHNPYARAQSKEHESDSAQMLTKKA